MKKCHLTLLVIILFGMGAGTLFSNGSHPSRVAVMTSAIDWDQAKLVDVMVKSIRHFGGEYSECPVYVAYPGEDESIPEMLKQNGVILTGVDISEKLIRYPFAFKAFAAARVESMTGDKFDSVIWLDPGVLVLGSLGELDLEKQKSSAVLRTVSLNNKIGLTRKDTLNEFWGRIYRETGLKYDEVPFLKTVVDRVEAKAYINCQVYSISPKLGILQKWAVLLEKLISDDQYQETACVGFWPKVFLHQAVFSGLTIAEIPFDKIKKMPLTSNYPVNHVGQMDPGDVIETLNDVHVAVFDQRWSRDPNWMKGIKIDEPLKKWLFDAYLEYLKLSDNIYRVEGSCASYLVITKDGSVLVDPGGAAASPVWFKKVMERHPLKVMVITHAHKDHWGNINIWKTDKNIKVIAQRKFIDYIEYTDRLSGFFARRNAIWSGKPLPEGAISHQKTEIEPNVFFADRHGFELGGIHFELVHTPGECPNHLTVWIPELKAVFVGDNYYKYFINNSTFRGTMTRPMLGYMKAIKNALDLNPEFFLPGHDKPIIGRENIKEKVTRFYNTLKYIHDETVEGMNQGKDVYTLMQEIKLPPELKIAPYYGKLAWTVRGIFHEYAGWFDEDPASMYSLPASGIYPDLVDLAGGTDRIADKALDYFGKGAYVKTLQLTAVLLKADPKNKRGHMIRLEALKKMKAATYNYIERIWLDYGIRLCNEALNNK